MKSDLLKIDSIKFAEVLAQAKRNSLIQEVANKAKFPINNLIWSSRPIRSLTGHVFRVLLLSLNLLIEKSFVRGCFQLLKIFDFVDCFLESELSR